MEDEPLSARVKRLREARRISQRQLEDRAGLGNGYVSLLEAGQRTPKPATLRKIAAALNVSEDVFIASPGEGTEDMEIDGIRASLLTMRELDPDEVHRVAVVVEAMVEDLKRRRREEDEAERRRRAAEQPGPGSKD